MEPGLGIPPVTCLGTVSPVVGHDAFDVLPSLVVRFWPRATISESLDYGEVEGEDMYRGAMASKGVITGFKTGKRKSERDLDRVA